MEGQSVGGEKGNVQSARITLVVPVFNNTAPEIRRMLQSVARQGVATHVVLVDDGSERDTADALAVAASSYEGSGSIQRIDVLRNEHQGVSAARNKGLKYVDTDFVAFMDADDTLAGHFFSSALGAIERTNAGVAFGAMTHWLTSGEAIVEHMGPKLGQTVVLTGDEIGVLRRSIFDFEALREVGLHATGYVSNAAALYRRGLVEGKRFETDVCISEDRLFNYQVLLDAQRVALVGESWYNYLQNPRSASQRTRLSAAQDLTRTAEAMDALRVPGDAPLDGSINVGILECFRQAVHLSILRPGYYRAARCPKTAYMRQLLHEDVFHRVFKTNKPRSRGERILCSLGSARASFIMVAAFETVQLAGHVRKSLRRPGAVSG